MSNDIIIYVGGTLSLVSYLQLIIFGRSAEWVEKGAEGHDFDPQYVADAKQVQYTYFSKRAHIAPARHIHGKAFVPASQAHSHRDTCGAYEQSYPFHAPG